MIVVAPPNMKTSGLSRTESPYAQGDAEQQDDDDAIACVLCFNAVDPSGAGGLTADTLALASVGAHPLCIATGAYTRDTTEIFDHVVFDAIPIAEQARAVLEDVPVQVIKVGFAGSPEALAVVAELASDYPELPLIAYMPDLSWWTADDIDAYLDAFRELVLPQTTVLVGNHGTLRRWLLPDWRGERAPGPRDIAQAAGESGVPYTLVTGLQLPGQWIDNVLSAPHAVLCSEKFERVEASFAGAGDTLSAALAALLATGCDLPAATTEALAYMDRCLDSGVRPGMGHVLPDRLFWAQNDEDDSTEDDSREEIPSASATLEGFALPPPDTRH